MIWLLKDFDLLSVILRALTLSLEALTVGGILFLVCVAWPAQADARLLAATRRFVSRSALAFVLAQSTATSLSVAILVGGSGVALAEEVSASFFYAGATAAGCALLLAILLRMQAPVAVSVSSPLRRMGWPLALCLPVALCLLASSVAMSHAASRMDNRVLLCLLTAAHHLGTAGWIGAMACLLAALRHSSLTGDAGLSMRLARRYSRLAIVSVVLLIGGGLGLAYFYIGSWNGLYGTSYGVLVMAKTWLMLTMLALGASNQRLLRGGAASSGLLLRLRRFSEAEIGLGFTAVLAAASLTSQAPAIDLGPGDRLTGHEIVERLRWQAPRMSSPPLSALAPPNSLAAALPQQQFGNGTENDANDRAWSEYNHHWAGLIVLAAATLALFSRALPSQGSPHRAVRVLRSIAQGWPLLFLGLALFILLRADPENWPLGPRPFWASFSRPDVLEHRFYALLLSGFAFFEWAVERHTLRSRRAAYFFPLACAAGGAALLTHAHALGSVHEEMLAEFSHTPIAVLGATAGWSRWLELRLAGRREARIASYVWPVCLILVGLVLMNYRES